MARRFVPELARALATQRVSREVQRAQRDRIGAKIRKLRAEGTPPSQAVATALHMAAKHRLGPRGGYRRVG